MDNKRILEAKTNFDNFLRDELLCKEQCNSQILKQYEDNAIESLISAKALFTDNISLLWTVVTSYYAMFYIASAYVYRKGYRSQHQIVHKVINEALIVFGRRELQVTLLDEYQEEQDKALTIAGNLLDSYELERTKRSAFQYEMTVELKRAKAKTSLQRAENFVDIFRKLLHK